MVNRVVTAVFAAALIVAGGLPLAAPASAAGITTVHLRVARCNGCVLTPRAMLLDASNQVVHRWEGAALTVRHGKATFQIPTDYTRGMSLGIDASWVRTSGPGVGFNAAPLVVLSEGQQVPNGFMFKDTTYCWAGTSKTSVTLRIRVERKKDHDAEGSTSWVVPLAYLTSLPRPKSVPGFQDGPWCLA